MKNIFSVKTLGHWWRGEVSVRYNLFTVARMLLGLIAVPFLLLFYAGKGLYLGAVWLFKRLKPPGFGDCFPSGRPVVRTLSDVQTQTED